MLAKNKERSLQLGNEIGPEIFVRGQRNVLIPFRNSFEDLVVPLKEFNQF